MERCYIAIDLKSFYASVECLQRGLDPMTTNLVVADESRTEKTICLAVSPSLKSFGIPGRPRLFEVVQRVEQANALRRSRAPGRELTGKSWQLPELKTHPELAVDYVVAPPQMSLYVQTSAAIYQTYLNYVAPEDIHVYSIDEVFLDVTTYLRLHDLPPQELARKIILDVLQRTGITATAGIGSNLYLCKIAMDIMAKKMPPDKHGVRIAQLDEASYRRQLWDHRPLTDFWRVGPGICRKLQQHGIYTMGDIARHSLKNEALFYKLFGVNAELLIDHAWGYETAALEDIQGYLPESSSISSGQVLQSPYPCQKAKLVTREMADLLALDLFEKGLVTDQIVLTIGYDIENLTDPQRARAYTGPVTRDHHGRSIPVHSHGTIHLGGHTASTRQIVEQTMALFDRIANPQLLIRRLNLTADHILPEGQAPKAQPEAAQLDLFRDVLAEEAEYQKKEAQREKEAHRQSAILGIQKKYGKNALLKGMNLEEGATAQERNGQIGGHKA